MLTVVFRETFFGFPLCLLNFQLTHLDFLVITDGFVDRQNRVFETAVVLASVFQYDCGVFCLNQLLGDKFGDILADTVFAFADGSCDGGVARVTSAPSRGRRWEVTRSPAQPCSAPASLTGAFRKSANFSISS